jgi:hypothetical protein
MGRVDGLIRLIVQKREENAYDHREHDDKIGRFFAEKLDKFILDQFQ